MQKREVQLTLEGETFTGILSNTSITEEKTKDDHKPNIFPFMQNFAFGICCCGKKENINFFCSIFSTSGIVKEVKLSRM